MASTEKTPKFGLGWIEQAEVEVDGASCKIPLNADRTVFLKRLPEGKLVLHAGSKPGTMFEDEGKLMIGLGMATNKLRRKAKKEGLK